MMLISMIDSSLLSSELDAIADTKKSKRKNVFIFIVLKSGDQKRINQDKLGESRDFISKFFKIFFKIFVFCH